MASCSACGTTILFGGTRDGDLRFCNAQCGQKGFLVRIANQIPPDAIREATTSIYHGTCPKCHGPGPVDVHTSYRVWSALLMTSWQSRPQISCRSCGRKRQASDAVFCLFLGWWGFPWGLLVTPVQVGRNIAGMFSSRGEHAPSKELEQAAGMLMASHAVQQQRQT
jgi:hypothetical protein